MPGYRRPSPSLTSPRAPSSPCPGTSCVELLPRPPSASPPPPPPLPPSPLPLPPTPPLLPPQGLPTGSDAYFWADEASGETYVKLNGPAVGGDGAHYVSRLAPDLLAVAPNATSQPLLVPPLPVPPYFQARALPSLLPTLPYSNPPPTHTNTHTRTVLGIAASAASAAACRGHGRPAPRAAACSLPAAGGMSWQASSFT